MSVDRREFVEFPRDDERAAWQGWMRRHGVNPNDVPIGDGFVEVDGRVIRYRALTRVDGRFVWPCGADEPLSEVRECQVYGRRPDPFPVMSQ